MKHFTQATANGLCTPPCGSSQSKSTRFFFLTLLLGLLTLGSTSAWANDYELHNPIGADGYYIVKWDCANNTWASSNDMEVDETFTFAIDITGNDYLLNSVANKANPFIAFRKYIGNDYSDGGVYNDNTNRLTRITGNIFGATYNFKLMDSGKTPAKIWAEFWNASDTWDWDGRKRITSPGKDGLFEFATNTDREDPCGSIDWTEGSTFDGWWADDNSHKGYTDPCVCASGGGDSGPTLTNWSFHGDMWLNGTGDNAGWVSGNNPNTPHFMDNGDGTATCSFIFPDAKCRLELFDNASVKTSNRCDGTTNLTTPEWNPNKYTFAATGSTKKYTFTLNLSNGRFTASAGAYTVQKTGWHVFMSAGGDDDPTEVGTITEEAGLVISDVASGNHNLYITDGSATTIAGVNWFGGLYIDKNNSDVAWATQREYYGDGKFSSTQFPIRGKRNAIGRFNLPTASDIIIAFDGGKITINKYVAPIPAENEYYVFGAGGTNWVTGWTKKVAEYKLTENAGVYTKTFYNVKGSGLEFKICDQNENQFTWSNFNQTKSNFTCTQNGTNIDFNTTGTKNYQQYWDVTVHFDGSEIWVTRELSELGFSANEFYVMGGGNNWTWDKNTKTDYNHLVKDGDVASISYPGINGNCSFKVFRASDQYEINWDYYSASKSTGTTMNNNGDDNIGRTFDGTKQLTIYFDGKNIWTDLSTPAITHTVTIHPNGGTAVDPLSVGDGQTISSISSTYGNGTAKWYKDENLTQEFILGTSTVTSDMHLYAKWGVSGNYYIVGDLHMYDNNGSWDNNKGWLLNYPSGSSTCAVSYIAPTGVNRFEIIKDRAWSQKIKINNSYTGVLNNTLSDVTLSEVDGHMQFTISESTPQKVTVHYDGKVWVTHEAYTPKYTGWRMTADGWDGQTAWSHSTLLDNTGKAIIRNVSAGQHQFKITDGDDGNVGIEEFNALYVDITNPSQGLTWASATTNYGKTNVPQSDNQYRNCTFTLENNASYMVNGKYDLQVTFDGGKIRCDILPKYTVSFNSNGGSEVASQSVFEGAQASEPSAPTKAGYEFVKWQLNGADYSFSSAVTGNITLDAIWAYKAISSVELNESEHTTWLGNSNFVLTPTMTPSDLITKKVEWSSNASGVASVVDGTVHAEGVGTATITCTVTDQFDNVRSATCVVTVAACEMTTDNLYSMTVTGYNSYSGDAALFELWNESSDNTEPATFRIVKLKLSNNYYIYDDNGTVKMSTDASLATAQWYEIPTNENFSPNWTGNNFALYEFKNVSTGKYLRRGEGRYGDNSSWYYYTTLTDNRETDGNIYKFFYDNTAHTHLVCREGVGNELRVSYALHNNNLNWPDGYSAHCAAPMVICGYTNDPNGNIYTQLHETFVVDDSYANPNYKASQMNSSYYRMKVDATVQANLANGLAYGSVITVRLYADAATSVKLQTAAGDDVETINLSADAAREYTYTVAYGSELVGATAFIIKAADNHAGIASIEVSRTHATSPDDPTLTWDADLSGGVTQSELAGTFQHVASSARSEGAIHYSSSDETVATVTADGTVTPLKAGSTTITATIEAEGCYGEAYIPYNVTLTEPTLAELIAADAGAGITLTHDYAEDAVIDKAITINGNNHAIGNLTVQMAGDLTLSGALTVNDFSIYAKAGNTTTPAASGQVRNATNLTVNGEAYFLYTVDPNGHVQYGWYDFTVPFRVNVMTGIKGIHNAVLNEDFVNERDYAVMEHLGEKQAAGEYAYKKFRGVMQPCRLYSITLDPQNNYNTIRFQKADGDLVAGNSVTLNSYSSAVDEKHANWNGVGNGTLHHADAGLSVPTIQVYQSGNKTFLPVDRAQYSLVIGSAFMVQQTGTMTLNQATHDKLLAPRRAASVQPTAIQIASEGQPFSDQLFISADEMAGQVYTQGADVAKAGNIGNVNVPQIWTNAYNSKLCAHEAQLINGEASYTLSLYAPANGSYTLTSKNIPEGYTLYLTQNGNRIWDLSERYVLDLTKGTATEYGLLLVENYKMPTAVENIGSKADETQKIMHNGILYILRNGKVFNAQGARVK